MFADYQKLIAKSRAYNFERWDILEKDILYNPPAYSDPVMLEMYEGNEYQYFIDHLTGWFNSRMNQMNREYNNRFPR